MAHRDDKSRRPSLFQPPLLDQFGFQKASQRQWVESHPLLGEVNANLTVAAVIDRRLEIGHFFGGCEQWCPHWRLQFLHFLVRAVMHTKRHSEFPSWIRRGGCAINRCRAASLAGADGWSIKVAKPPYRYWRSPPFFIRFASRASIRWLRDVDRPPRRSLSLELLIARGTLLIQEGSSCSRPRTNGQSPGGGL